MIRELTSHKVNGLNEQITIQVLDEPGSGGANHVYGISAADPVNDDKTTECLVKFQKGPINETGINGISQEALLAIVEDRLASFQAGSYACHYNEWALKHVRDALRWLHKRTTDRVERGVEGTSKV